MYRISDPKNVLAYVHEKRTKIHQQYIKIPLLNSKKNNMLKMRSLASSSDIVSIGGFLNDMLGVRVVCG